MGSATPAARRHAHRHPVNIAHIDDAPRGARIADRATTFIGSWRFIVLQTVIVAIWVAGNRQAARDRLTLEHASEETDVAEQQNKELLRGKTEILDRIERLEHLILEIESRILERLPANG